MTDTAADPLDIDTANELCDDGMYWPYVPDGDEAFSDLARYFTSSGKWCQQMADQSWEITDFNADEYPYYNYDHPVNPGYGPCWECCAPATHVFRRGDTSVGLVFCDEHNATPPDEHGKSWYGVTDQVKAIRESETQGIHDWVGELSAEEFNAVCEELEAPWRKLYASPVMAAMGRPTFKGYPEYMPRSERLARLWDASAPIHCGDVATFTGLRFDETRRRIPEIHGGN